MARHYPFGKSRHHDQTPTTLKGAGCVVHRIVRLISTGLERIYGRGSVRINRRGITYRTFLAIRNFVCNAVRNIAIHNGHHVSRQPLVADITCWWLHQVLVILPLLRPLPLRTLPHPSPPHINPTLTRHSNPIYIRFAIKNKYFSIGLMG